MRLGSIALHIPTSTLFLISRVDDGFLCPGEARKGFKVSDCITPSLRHLQGAKKGKILVGDRPITFECRDDLIILSDDIKRLGVRVPKQSCDFDGAVRSFTQFFGGALVDADVNISVLGSTAQSQKLTLEPEPEQEPQPEQLILDKAPQPRKIPRLPSTLHAVTLHRPWAYAVCEMGKDIENRDWRCPLPPGSWIAIHAGKKFDQGAAQWIKAIGYECPPDGEEHPTGIVAVAKFGGNVTESESLWFVGSVGWVLDEVWVVDPVECRGQQKLWTVPSEVREQVVEALKKSVMEEV